MEFPASAEVLAKFVGAVEVRGDAAAVARRLSGLEEAVSGDLTFAVQRHQAEAVRATGASVVLVPPGFAVEPRPGQALVVVAAPSWAVTLICRELERAAAPARAPGVHPTAVVAPGARVDPAATVGPLCHVDEGAEVAAGAVLESGVTVGRGAVVGADTWLGPRVVVYPGCRIGARVRLHAGVVIGADGFGYEFRNGRHEKVPQVGTVEIGDDVEIGANSCVDRARLGRTVVGAGTKVDNLVQVGHNVQVGRHCILVAGVAVGGSTVFEDYVAVGGQAGFAGHLRVGRGAKVAAQSGVAHDIAAGEVVMGTPAIPARREQRFAAVRDRLPEVLRRLDRLERGSGGSEAGKRLPAMGENAETAGA